MEDNKETKIKSSQIHHSQTVTGTTFKNIPVNFSM